MRHLHSIHTCDRHKNIWNSRADGRVVAVRTAGDRFEYLMKGNFIIATPHKCPQIFVTMSMSGSHKIQEHVQAFTYVPIADTFVEYSNVFVFDEGSFTCFEILIKVFCFQRNIAGEIGSNRRNFVLFQYLYRIGESLS